MLRKFIVICSFSLAWVISQGQEISSAIKKAYSQFTNDPQLKHALSSLYIIEAESGAVIFDHNSAIGLAPASTQKVLTAIAAFELLGPKFRYRTEFSLAGDSSNAQICVKPSGDPTLGSWRWESTRENMVISKIIAAVKQRPSRMNRLVLVDSSGWESEGIPDGWIWQDIGNYYGAGAGIFNWRENQFDILLSSGPNIGEPVLIAGTHPSMKDLALRSKARGAAAGTGDNAYLYYSLSRQEGVVRGTIPVNQREFIIAAAMPSAVTGFQNSLMDAFQAAGSSIDQPGSLLPEVQHKKPNQLLFTETSPPLDSIVYWLLKKSINLYAEALLRTMASKFKGNASTDSGTALLRAFWRSKGVDEKELNLHDGSGLSPLNRITTHAQAEVLRYARRQAWFPQFYNSLPEYNGMKLKSGTISDVKGFCGYHRSAGGREYIISFLVNNFSGSSAELVNKMFGVLNILK